jgi:maltose/moltooligosaccharide transporter
MLIVVPMLIQTLTFGYILKNFLNNDSGKAILFAGILLIIAAGFTLLIQTKNNGTELEAEPVNKFSGH